MSSANFVLIFLLEQSSRVVKKRESVISTAATMRVLNIIKHWVSKHQQVTMETASYCLNTTAYELKNQIRFKTIYSYHICICNIMNFNVLFNRTLNVTRNLKQRWSTCFRRWPATQCWTQQNTRYCNPTLLECCKCFFNISHSNQSILFSSLVYMEDYRFKLSWK